MANSQYFSPLAKFRLAPLVWSSAVFLPRWSETPFSAASSSLKCRQYKVRFPVSMDIESLIICADTVDAFKATFAV